MMYLIIMAFIQQTVKFTSVARRQKKNFLARCVGIIVCKTDIYAIIKKQVGNKTLWLANFSS